MNKSFKPPSLAEWLLKRLTYYNDRYYSTGDLQENYNHLQEDKGNIRARVWYWSQVLKSILPYLSLTFITGAIMFKSYLKTALRNIKRSKGFSFINIAGLSVGMTCFILIMLFVSYEFSYDRYHENADNIYRVVLKRPGNVWLGTDWWNNTPGTLKAPLMQDCPEIERIARINKKRGVFHFEEKHYIENRFFIVDPEFLEIFSFPFVAGDPKTALDEPMNLLLTEEMADKYFGGENPIGKILNLDGKYDYKITGILKNVPANSHFKFDFLAPFNTLYTINKEYEEWLETWQSNDYQTYIQIFNNIGRHDFENKFPVPHKKYSGKDWNVDIYLQPLKDIHLKGHMNGELEANSDIRYIYLFLVIALLILLIACLNYMNLSTARSAKRSREIGVRKVVGAVRASLIRQFIGESIVLSFIALSVSIIIVKLVLPGFSAFVERDLSFNFYSNLELILSLICTVVTVGIVSGIYPAFFLSSIKPASVIKSTSGKSVKTKLSLRNSLVVFQFIISIVLIFCTIAIYDQLKYINNKDLGYNKEHIIILNLQSNELRRNYVPLKNELLQYSRILDITASHEPPDYITEGGDARWEGKTEDDDINFYRTYVDYNYFDFYEMNVLAGRKFSKDIVTDKETAYILNKTAVEAIGWDNPIGKGFKHWEEGSVIGVADDFHFHDLGKKVQPLVIKLINSDYPGTIGCLSLKISPEDISGTLAFVENKYKEFSSDFPFTYSFLDERIDRMYKSEQRLGKSFLYFTAIAIFIACLGLFGLASYVAECKTKEIGIRKAMGATINNVVSLLGMEFLKWIILSAVISYPIGYYAVNEWLQQNFVYRTDIDLEVYVFSGALAIVITILSVGYQSLKAAYTDPVDSLRNE